MSEELTESVQNANLVLFSFSSIENGEKCVSIQVGCSDDLIETKFFLCIHQSTPKFLFLIPFFVIVFGNELVPDGTKASTGCHKRVYMYRVTRKLAMG